MRETAGLPRARLGLLDDRRDRQLLVLTLVLSAVDFAQLSWWSTAVKPLGDEQRWLTVLLQAGYVAANASRIPGLVRGHPAFLALVAFCAASAGWSVEPATSALGAARLLLLGAGIRIGQERHGGRFLARVFLRTCGALVALNLAALALPSRSFMTGSLAGAFRGLTDHKNTLGQLGALTLAFLLAAAAAPGARGRALALLLAVALTLATIALTRSATAAALAATALGILAVEGILRRFRLPVLTGLLLASLAAGGALLLATGAIDPLAAMGRDPTLTGRADIWAFVEAYVQERPWLGFGYRAFPLAELLRVDPRWGLGSYVVGSTHNAYLAIVTELGYAGLAAYAAWLAALVSGRFPRGDREEGLRAAMVLGVYLVSGLTESFAGLSPGLYLAGLLIAFHRPRPPGGLKTR